MVEKVENALLNIENAENLDGSAIKDNNLDDLVNKRIYLDKKTLKRIEIMMAVYLNEKQLQSKEIDKLSAIIQSAVNNLFEKDYPNKIKEL